MKNDNNIIIKSNSIFNKLIKCNVMPESKIIIALKYWCLYNFMFNIKYENAIINIISINQKSNSGITNTL